MRRQFSYLLAFFALVRPLHRGLWTRDGGNSWYERWFVAASDGISPKQAALQRLPTSPYSGYCYPDVSISLRAHADERSCSCSCELRQPRARQDERLPQPVQLSTAP